MAKDPEAGIFKRLEGLQPCEVSELKPGTHIFAVYGLFTISYQFFSRINCHYLCSSHGSLENFVKVITFLSLLGTPSKLCVQGHLKI